MLSGAGSKRLGQDAELQPKQDKLEYAYLLTLAGVSEKIQVEGRVFKILSGGV